MVPLFLRSTELKLIRVAATNAFPLRGRWHEVTDEVFKIVNQYVCHKPVGAGSRLPTRSNRKTIATGNLRPRPPTQTNKRRKLNGIIIIVKNKIKCLDKIQKI